MKTLIIKSRLWPCVVSAILLLLNSTTLWAVCTVPKGTVTFTISVPSSLNIPRDTPIGAEVYRSDPISLARASNFQCQSGDREGYQSEGGTSNNGPSPLGDSGLGWRMVIDDEVTPPYPNGGSLGNYNYVAGNAGSIRLYKMGEVSTLSSGTLGSFVAGGKKIFNFAISNAINPSIVSCETPSVNVPLGNQKSSQFKGVGSTIGERAFNIQLNNCPAGINSISYRLDPVNTAFDAKKGILALNPGGATGVGIQITDDSSAAVSLGEFHNVPNSVAAGNHTTPLKSAYYKTADIVGGGTANASMQFSITYQ